MREQKFFRCKHCGNFVSSITDSGVPMLCCGEIMGEVKPNTVEASTEKHIPDVTISGDTVSVKIGSVPHPMEEKHHIEFITLETENGAQIKYLKVPNEAAATFKLTDDKLIAVYEYCNIHGLWVYKV